MQNDLNITRIVNVYFRQSQNWNRDKCKPRRFDAIVLFTEGEIEYYFPHKTVVARKGDILFLPGNLPYNGRRISEFNSFFVIDFLCGEENQFEKFGAPCAFPASDFQHLFNLFETVLHLWNLQPIDTVIALKAHIYTLLRERFLEREQDTDRTTGNQILRYMESSIGDPSISVSKICKKLYISDSQLRRNVHKLTGMSPNAYLTEIRLNKAKTMLAATGQSIKDISHACGFTSPGYFSRVFTQKTGMSPSEYREHTTDSG